MLRIGNEVSSLLCAYVKKGLQVVSYHGSDKPLCFLVNYLSVQFSVILETQVASYHGSDKFYVFSTI